MGWILENTYATPTFGDESWTLVPLPLRVGILSYAFRLRVPSTTPLSWAIAGYWGFIQDIEEYGVMSRSHPIPLVGRGASQVLRVVGAQDIDLVTGPNDAFYLVYYVNRWVETVDFQVFTYN